MISARRVGVGIAALVAVAACAPAPGAPIAALPNYDNQTVLGWASATPTSLQTEERDFGITSGLVSAYVDFAHQSEFPRGHLKAAAEREGGLLVAWEPWDSADPATDQADYRPADIAAGSLDGYITNWLTSAQAAAVEYPQATVLVRFAPEANDGARPWSVGNNEGNSAADYIDMWRHVYSIKQAVAPDIVFVWNALNYGSATPSITDVYPGADYVDILALDGFNWADVRGGEQCQWQSYDDVFSTPVAEIRALADTAGKPWGIAELGSAPADPSSFTVGTCATQWSWVFDNPVQAPYYNTAEDWITQEGWVATAVAQAHDQGALFVNVFHRDKETDWRLNDTDAGRGLTREIDPEQYVFGNAPTDRTASGYLKAALGWPAADTPPA